MKIMDKIEILVQLKEKMLEAKHTDLQLYHQLENLMKQILSSSQTVKSI